MKPILFGQGEWYQLESYFFLIVTGILVALWLIRREGMKQGLDAPKVVDLCIYMVIIGVVGARIFHVLFDGMLQDYIDLCVDPNALGRYLPDGAQCVEDAQCVDAEARGIDIGVLCNTETGECVPEQDCLRPAKFWAGGLTYYGGFLFAVPVLFFFARRWQWKPMQFFDIVAPALALGHAFGRFGCFLSGCCYGAVCKEGPWGVSFPGGSPAYRDHTETHRSELVSQYQEVGEWISLPVHPTQLYEVFALTSIFGLLWFGLMSRKRFHGEVTAWFLVLYGMSRFTLEFWRADQRGGLWVFSTSQWVSFGLVTAGAALLMWGYKAMSDGRLQPLRVGGGAKSEDLPASAEDVPGSAEDVPESAEDAAESAEETDED